jgi:hypothetical protein
MRLVYLLVLLLVLILSSSSAFALSQKQARKLISQIAGSSLPGSAVRIKSLTENGSEAEATAEIETAFRLVQDREDRWQVAEVRVGQNRWEETSVIASAFNRPAPELACLARELSKSGEVLSVRRARCLLAHVLGIELPSDALRIRSVSSLGVPLASPSAVVVARLEADVKFVKEGDWRVSQIRTGNGGWINVEGAVAALNDAKRKRAQADLATLARALEEYRRTSGFYVVSDKEPVLIDHLSPRYLQQVIRLDPWGNPYKYQGQTDRFLLTSLGPDGKENTPDDITVSGPASRPS